LHPKPEENKPEAKEQKELSEAKEKKHHEQKEISELKEKVKRLEEQKGKEVSELREILQRLQAEFENSRKRFEKEKKDFIEFANAETIRELLPLLDSFQAAIEKTEKHENVSRKEALDGLDLLQKQLVSIMHRHGLQEIKSLGEKANPMLHEVIAFESNSKKDDEIIIEEIQKGFLLKGKLLRPAKVKINKK
jgi:molecular chaperone GrpE